MNKSRNNGTTQLMQFGPAFGRGTQSALTASSIACPLPHEPMGAAHGVRASVAAAGIWSIKAPTADQLADAEHSSYLSRMDLQRVVPPAVVRSARAVWDALRAAVPGLRVPGASAFDGRIFYSWDRGRHHLEAEFLPNGEWEWFYTDRETRAVAGADMATGDFPSADLISHARTILAD